MMIKFLKKIFLVELLRGLLVTLGYQFGRKATIQYPEKVKESRERFRGMIRLFRDDEGEPLCIACKLCQRSCPNYCFDIEGKRNEAGNPRPVKFDWKLDKCTFCGFCVEACPTDALRFTGEFRLSTTEKPRLRFDITQMYSDFELMKHFKGDPEK